MCPTTHYMPLGHIHSFIQNCLYSIKTNILLEVVLYLINEVKIEIEKEKDLVILSGVAGG